jgi:hypothetical protein
MYPDPDVAETGFTFADSPAMANKNFSGKKVFNCSCGLAISDATEISKHSFECMRMQQDGYS